VIIVMEMWPFRALTLLTLPGKRYATDQNHSAEVLNIAR
jgi:hypothetical protein